MKKALFIYRTKRKKVLVDWKKNRGPDSLLFGSNHLKKFKVEADFFDTAYSPFNLLHPVFYPFEHAIINVCKMGFKLDQALFLLPKFNNYDVIVATGDSAGLPILFLKNLGLIKKPVIFMTAGLAGALKGKTNTWVGKFYRQILKEANVFTSYSQVEIDFFRKEMGVKNIEYMPLVTDYNYFSKSSHNKKEIICAVGTEAGRDYKTFFKAISNLPINAEVACHPDNIKGLKIPSNVKVHINIPVSEVRKIYQKSLISVVPCKERFRSSGQMVVLESAAASLPIVASSIKGLQTAFNFKNTRDLIYTTPNDDSQMKKAIMYLLKNPKEASSMGNSASKKVRKEYTTEQLASRLANFINLL